MLWFTKECVTLIMERRRWCTKVLTRYRRKSLFLLCSVLIVYVLVDVAPSRLEVKINYKRAEHASLRDLHNRPEYRQSHVKLLLGYERDKKDLLKIGIPTLGRRNGPLYILETLRSLLANADKDDMLETSVVVQISDSNQTFSKLVCNKIEQEFSPQLKTGFIQVTKVDESTYPPFTGLKQNFGDSPERVGWRSKQNIDVSYLMSYCYNKSKFYLNLEDDVLAAPKYIKYIKDYIRTIQKPWVMLEFTRLGSIAKLFKNEDLNIVSSLLRHYYQEQPIDFLFNFHLSLTMQQERYIRIPTLFQHVGHVSSLPNQTRDYGDNFFFDFEPKHWKTTNPKAKIWTSLGIFNNFTVDKAYSNDYLGFFWGFSLNNTDHIVIIFEAPQVIEKIIIKTGVKADKVKDVLSTGYLEFSTDKPAEVDGKVDCRHYEVLGKFYNGTINVSHVSKRASGLHLVTCLKITIFEMKGKWIFIQDISILGNKI